MTLEADAACSRGATGQLIGYFKEREDGAEEEDFFHNMTAWKLDDKERIQKEIDDRFTNSVFEDTDPRKVFNRTILDW